MVILKYLLNKYVKMKLEYYSIILIRWESYWDKLIKWGSILYKMYFMKLKYY